jgi:2-polyprenyl-3-methyl-5-hydroxy-6-metoxy-1,4-benzoquinol methylase
MRYKVGDVEIRSENAAKPGSSAGRWVLAWIATLERDSTALDLGCGKFRYTVHLARRLRHVTAVDSSEQIGRTQTLFGNRCSLRDYALRNLSNVSVYAVEESGWRRSRYPVILCSNVLSAIPCGKTRREVVRNAYDQLHPDGQFLVTTQYRNSHFTGWQTDPRARQYLDGFLVAHQGGTSFYGMINAGALVRLCQKTGFTVIRSGHVKELAYVLATRIRSKASG